MRTFAKQEKVIELLKAGCEIYNRRNEYTGKYGQLVYSSLTWTVSNCKDIDVNVHHSTIQSLKNKGIITKEKPYSLIN